MAGYIRLVDLQSTSVATFKMPIESAVDLGDFNSVVIQVRVSRGAPATLIFQHAAYLADENFEDFGCVGLGGTGKASSSGPYTNLLRYVRVKHRTNEGTDYPLYSVDLVGR